MPRTSNSRKLDVVNFGCSTVLAMLAIHTKWTYPEYDVHNSY